MKLTIDEIRKMASAWDQVQEAKKKKMDPVGKADADIDNDGDVDSSDEYLHKRRKAVSKAMKGKQTETEVQESVDLDEAAVVTHKWYSVKHWKDGSHHFDNLDDHLRGHEDSVKHAMTGNTARKRPDHHFGIPVKAKGAISYMDKHAKGVNESVELDELSKKTLGSYAKKASDDLSRKSTESGYDSGRMAYTNSAILRKKANKRLSGIKTAVNKLTKEAKDHGNMNNGSPRGEGLSPSAKKELARTTPMPDAVNEPMIDKKTFDAIRASGKKAPMRSNDNAQGDKTAPKTGK